MEQNNISNKLTFPPSAPPKQPSQVEPKRSVSINSLQNNDRVPSHIFDLWTSFLSPSGDLEIGLVWHNLSPPPPHFGPTVEILFKLNQIINDGSSVVQMILDVFRCS